MCNDKKIFHAFCLISGPTQPEVINITLPRVNNFDIKQNKPWNICFIICNQHQTSSGKIKANKTQQISDTTQGFLRKN